MLLVTYNHEQFIRQAIDSILMQTFSGKIVIVVADDGSHDATVAVIRAYEEAGAACPFIFLPAHENVGITRNYERGFAACTGDYVAVLEGDDYWTDPLKLEKQVAFLESHRECVACGTNYIVFEEVMKRFTPRVPTLDGWTYLTSRSLIYDNVIGNFSTCMYRAASLRLIPPSLFRLKAYDWALHIILGQFGPIGFLQSPMSVYRIHPGGTWGALTNEQRIVEQIDLIHQYDQATSGIFHAEFDDLARRLTASIVPAMTGAPPEGTPAPAPLPPQAPRVRALRRVVTTALAVCPPFILSIVKLTLPPAFANRLKNAIR